MLDFKLYDYIDDKEEFSNLEHQLIKSNVGASTIKNVELQELLNLFKTISYIVPRQELYTLLESYYEYLRMCYDYHKLIMCTPSIKLIDGYMARKKENMPIDYGTANKKAYLNRVYLAAINLINYVYKSSQVPYLSTLSAILEENERINKDPERYMPFVYAYLDYENDPNFNINLPKLLSNHYNQ